MELEIRRTREDDLPAILRLLGETLGRGASDPRAEELFRWKHLDNAFGPSQCWVACDGARIVGFRAFMRWEFEYRGRVLRAVRAVDTATDPHYQRRGIFRTLTLNALDELRSSGTDLVFNTPNLQSGPGYLAMGWKSIGRIPVSVYPRSIAGLVRAARSRVAASLWPEAASVGGPAPEVFGDAEPLAALLDATRPPSGMRTRVSAGSLAWRYGAPFLGYRAVVADAGLAAGVAVFRVRRRGPARELTLCELILGDRSAREVRRSILARLRREVAADFIVGAPPMISVRDGFVPLPRGGPLLVCNPLSPEGDVPASDWSLTPGDVELL